MPNYDSQTFATLINLDMVAIESAKGETKKRHIKTLNTHVDRAIKAFSDSRLPSTLMHDMATFHRSHSASIKYLEPLVFKLYNAAYITSNPLAQKQAQNLLIFFFSPNVPQTLKGKLMFLNALSQKQDILSSGKIVAPMLDNLIYHYIQQGQYKQDKNLKFVHKMVNILDTFSNEKNRRILTNPIRRSLMNTVINLQTLAPEIITPYFKKWSTKFSPFSPRQYNLSRSLSRELGESPDAIHLVRKSRTQQRD